MQIILRFLAPFLFAVSRRLEEGTLTFMVAAEAVFSFTIAFLFFNNQIWSFVHADGLLRFTAPTHLPQ